MRAARFSLQLLAVVMGFVSSAAAIDSPAVANAKARHEAAAAKSAQEITEIYKTKLLELKQKYVTARDNAAIAAVTAELTRIGVKSPALSKSPVGSASKDNAPAVGDDKYFSGKSWFSSASAEYHFNRDATGVRTYQKIETPFTWRKLETGIVEVVGRTTPAGAPVTWYFKFDNRKTALFGTSSANIVDPLFAEP